MNAFKKNNFNTILIVVLIVINIASLSFMLYNNGTANDRRQHKDNRRKGADRAMNFLKKELNLSKLQVIEFNKLKKRHHHEIRKANDRIKGLHDVLFENIGNDKFDPEKIADSIASYQKQIELNTYDHFKSLRLTCAPDQQKKFDAVVKDMLRFIGSSPNKRPPNK